MSPSNSPTRTVLASPRVVALATWLGLLALAFVFSPPASADTPDLVHRMVTGHFAGVNRSLLSLFNLMGVLPVALLALLAFDSERQRIWKWPFVLGAFALGAFALLPYLVLRTWGLPGRPATSRGLRLLAHPAFGGVLCGVALSLSSLFLAGGDFDAFVTRTHHDSFAFVMSCDCLACSIAGLLLAREDAARTPRAPPSARFWWAALPGIGLPLYLAVRRPIARGPLEARGAKLSPDRNARPS